MISSITKQKIISFLNVNLQINEKDIIKIKQIKKGFTNQIYYVLLKNNQTLKLRIAAKNQFINRELENFIEMHLYKKDFLYYNKKNGDYVRKWINGKSLKFNDLDASFWIWINEILLKLHCLKLLNNIKITDCKYYDDLTIFNNTKYNKIMFLYKTIVDKFNKEDFVLSHNDCSSNNILITKNHQYYLLDFEWASYNHKLWDICNLIKDLNLKYNDIIFLDFINEKNINEYLKIIFCTYCYTLIWTTRVKMTYKIKKYQNFIKRRIIYWYKILLKYDINN